MHEDATAPSKQEMFRAACEALAASEGLELVGDSYTSETAPTHKKHVTLVERQKLDIAFGEGAMFQKTKSYTIMQSAEGRIFRREACPPGVAEMTYEGGKWI